MNTKRKKVTRTIVISLACVSIAYLGLSAGFNYTTDKKILKKPNIKANIGNVERDDGDIDEDNNDVVEKIKDEVIALPIKDDSDKIADNTILIYEYYHLDDGKFEITKEDAPYFLIGKNKKEIEDLYTEWDLISFDEKEVVLRKEVEGFASQKYIVGIMDGLITVFYKEEKDGTNVKDITSTPVSVLPIEEQEKLLYGIEVSGDEELMRILEDYGS